MVSIRHRLYPRIERLVVGAGWFREEDSRCWRSYRRAVFVCTGNICRSPYAELVARARGIEAVSCGVDTHTGLPANEMAIAEAGRRGRDMTPHRTTRWQDLLLESDDIIVATELRHAMAVREKASASTRPIVLLSSLLPDDFQVLRDPYGCSQQEFSRVFDLIDRSVGYLARRMRGDYGTMK